MGQGSTKISYTGFNEIVDKNIRAYSQETEDGMTEMESGFCVISGVREFLFQGTFTHGEQLELTDMGQQYDLRIKTDEGEDD